ncbi:MAG: TolC family protein, partial [Trueperaceae bacterium]
APLPLEGWRLWLPDVAPDRTPAVVRAELDAAVASAALARVRVGGVLGDLALDVAYVLPEARLRASFDLDEGRPGAAIDAALRPATRSSWSVAVGATVRIDDRTASELASARADHEAAQAALAAARAEAPWALEAARRAALDAEADVGFAERALDLGRTALAEAVERHRTAVADTDAEAARDRADAALARAAVGFDRERDAFYRAWNAYTLAVERYLVAAGSPGGLLAPP